VKFRVYRLGLVLIYREGKGWHRREVQSVSFRFSVNLSGVERVASSCFVFFTLRFTMLNILTCIAL